MAEIKLNYSEIRRVSNLEALRIMDKVVDKVHLDATLKTIAGPYSKGRLALSLRKKTWISSTGAGGRVWSDLKYAKWVHDGVPRHKIVPLGRGYPLRFFWRKTGRTERFWSVNHPGQRAQLFLTEPLQHVARRYNMIVVVHHG